MEASNILVADDQRDILEALSLLLKHAGHRVLTASSPAEVLAAIEREDFGVVLMDLNYARDTTSGREGLDLLSRIQLFDPTLPLVVMTAWGSLEGAVEAMRRGARDYVQKPWDNERLLHTLRTQIELGATLRQTRRLEHETSRLRNRDLPQLIAESASMKPVLHLMERIAPSDAQVLITGEHGTGKEVVARWLHAASKRSSGPFIAINAGAVSDGVFESELFGHVKGAFTDAKANRPGCLELAENGTLFLDEVANMPLVQQAKLLRVLQTREYQPVGSSRVRKANVRFVAATNVDVASEVEQGRFRQDLLYRLNTVEIRVPPLRERRDDILPLALHFARQLSAQYGQSIREFSPKAVHGLLAHVWPGNVRELEHVVERAILLAQGSAVQADDLLLTMGTNEKEERLEQMTLDAAERYLIQSALARNAGQVAATAKALGLSRSALYRRLLFHGLKGNE